MFSSTVEKIGIKEIKIIQSYLEKKGRHYDLKILKHMYEGLLVMRDKGCWTDEDWSTYKTRYKKPAHRISYEIFFGNAGLDKVACHHCDRPGCRNPFHIFMGTEGDNHQDAVRKGRVSQLKIKKKRISKEESDYIRGVHWRNLERFAGSK